MGRAAFALAALGAFLLAVLMRAGSIRADIDSYDDWSRP